MNTDARAEGKRIADRLLADLDEDRLRRELDDGIDEAVSGYVRDAVPVRSQKVFLDVIADFVRHLYESGLRVPRILTSTQARADAIAQLEQHYPRTSDSGYEEALLDATSSGDQGMELVLAHMAEIIKLRERIAYKRWVFSDHLTRCSWTTRCAIAEYLLDRCAPLLPPRLAGCHPAQLADEIPALIAIELSTGTWLGNVRSGTDSFRAP